MKFIMRDQLSGVTKIRTIMGKKSYCCRKCGTSYAIFSNANKCCKKERL